MIALPPVNNTNLLGSKSMKRMLPASTGTLPAINRNFASINRNFASINRNFASANCKLDTLLASGSALEE